MKRGVNRETGKMYLYGGSYSIWTFPWIIVGCTQRHNSTSPSKQYQNLGVFNVVFWLESLESNILYRSN